MTFLQFVISKFTKSATDQENKGIEKYGHELQPMDPKWDWLNMAEEELIDGFKYLCAERERRDKVLREVFDELTRIQEPMKWNKNAAGHYGIELVKMKLTTLSKNLS